MEANDRVLQLFDRLDPPNVSRGKPDRLRTVSDGKKFEVRVDSLSANYSYKWDSDQIRLGAGFRGLRREGFEWDSGWRSFVGFQGCQRENV